ARAADTGSDPTGDAWPSRGRQETGESVCDQRASAKHPRCMGPSLSELFGLPGPRRSTRNRGAALRAGLAQFPSKRLLRPTAPPRRVQFLSRVGRDRVTYAPGQKRYPCDGLHTCHQRPGQ
ncbi:MAG: hypothetical protein ACI9F9_000686, partial [Candidatus Paceibacteria bacterium]